MRKYTSSFALLFLVFFIPFSAQTCSMYKLSKDGTTVVGCNEDAWRTTPHIWFEKSNPGNYGCCFTGSRKIGKDKHAAQSGMNEFGLTFSRLASFHPERKNNGKKKLIQHPDLFLMDVLKTCKSIDDVYNKLDQYDRTCYLQDVLVYIEPSGNYLIVEPYQLIRGSDPSFVQANFCPSITSEKDRRKQERYRKGKEFLSGAYTTSPEFCSNLSQEMHVCRDKVGDGTLLTSIWDTKKLEVTLYFYHNYAEKIVFNLKEEFDKGDHQFEVSSLFSNNLEFEQLKNYVTPFNSDWIRMILALMGLLFLFSALYFGVSSFSQKYSGGRFFRILFSIALLIFFGYMFVLTTNIEIYYFASPYRHYSSFLITLSSYTPYLILVLFSTIVLLHWKREYFKNWSGFSKGLLFINSSLLACLILALFYWGILP